MVRNGRNDWNLRQQRIAVADREKRQRRARNTLWVLAAIIIVLGTPLAIIAGSKAGYIGVALFGLVCFTVITRAKGQHGPWTIYGLQGLTLPFAAMLAAWAFGSSTEIVVAATLGFAIFGLLNVMERVRQNAEY